MDDLKVLLLSFLALATTLQAGEPWAWLNGELGKIDQRQIEMVSVLDRLPPLPMPQQHERAGFHSGFAPKAESVRWVQVDLGDECELDSVVAVPAMLGTEAYGFPKRFRIDASNDPLFAESTTLTDQTTADVSATLAPWSVDGHKAKARFVRFTATKLAPQPGLGSRFIFCLGELLVFSGGRNVALQSKVLAPNAAETLPTWSPRHLVDGTYALGLPVKSGGKRSNGWHSAISASAEGLKWVQVDLGSPQEVDEIRLIPAHPSDYPDRFGFGFPHRFKVEADGKVVFDSTSSDFVNPGDTPVAFPTPGLRVQTLRITATKLWERSGDFVFALAELQAFQKGNDLAIDSKVTSSDDTISAAWKPEFLVDGCSSAGVLIDDSTWLADLSKRRELTHELAELNTLRSAGLSIAKTRAVWLAGLVLSAAVLSTVAMFGNSRRNREREMEVLRDRISRDLHDDIGSHLGSIRLMAELALRDGSDTEFLDEIHRLAGEAAESMRGIIWLVREGDAPKLSSLVEAMRRSAADLLKGVEWRLDASMIDADVAAPLHFHRQVFLFFREALHNISRHADATQVQIEASGSVTRFHLSIVDDGCGFDAAAASAGQGLANLRHRAEVLGGAFHIISEPGKGTRIQLEVGLS